MPHWNPLVNPPADIIVAVLSSSKERFDDFVHYNGLPGRKYIFIGRRKDVVYREFDEVEYCYNWASMPDPWKTKNEVLMRIRNKK